MTRLAVFNCKGGVGKTTTALNLGAALARNGRRVCLMDLDPQAHLSRVFGHEPPSPDASLFAYYAGTAQLPTLAQDIPGIGSLLPSHSQLMKADSLFGKGPTTLNRLKVGLDNYAGLADMDVVMDCCPYVGVLSLGAIFAADMVLVPVASDYLSMQGAQQILRVLKALEPVLKRRVPRRLVMTRYDRRRRMTEDVRQQLAAMAAADLCRTVISENVALAMSPMLGKDVFAHQPSSRGAQDYLQLFQELQGDGLL